MKTKKTKNSLFKHTIMKHLLLFFLFSGSLKSFSQVADTTNLRIFDGYVWGKENLNQEAVRPTPDTLRAVMLVTLPHMYHGIAHARMGFVIVQPGHKTIYLDCNKRPLKYPAKGWGYEVVDKTD